jgi:hypothetical protein
MQINPLRARKAPDFHPKSRRTPITSFCPGTDDH